MATSGGELFSTSLLRLGTDEPPERLETLTAGSLSCELVGAAMRHLRWNGHEVLRGIEFIVRDENWGTWRPDVRLQRREEDGHSFRLSFEAEVAGGALRFVLDIEGDATGHLCCRARATAYRDFHTNRTGFVVLHPIEGVAGSEVAIEHVDGRVETGRFPLRISPGQPFFDIAAIRHAPAPGLHAQCRFAGEVFEMEDQRNWTDASFKTYCRPLALPFPYVIAEGSRIEQAVLLRIEGSAPPRPSRARPTLRLGEPTGETMPELALAFEAGWMPRAEDEALVRQTGVTSLLVRLDLRGDPEAAVSEALRAGRAFDLPLKLELVTPDEGDLDALLAAVAGRLRTGGARVLSVTALPAAYLRSYQPEGPWPGTATPEDARDAARRAWPRVPIGGGMLTNFTELNRRPPQPPFDFVTHGTCAVVHAADDVSVMETLECLPHVFASGRALAGAAGYRLGLVAIGARSNPYGARTADNRHQGRVPMAQADPRQRGLFAAAFAVGAVAATAGSGISRLALAAPAGPFGCIYRRGEVPQPAYDELAADRRPLVYPLYHVLRLLAGGCGRPRITCATDEPRRVAALAWRQGNATAICLANLGSGYERVALGPLSGSARILDEDTVAGAITDPWWTERGGRAVHGEIELGPYAVARIDCRGEG